MPFQPYHQFANRTKLERLVKTSHEGGNITDDINENFNRYHIAMIHKLKSAKYNLDRLIEKLTQTEIQEAADTSGDFMFEVNMYIDGFFYNAGSAMDILARLVLTLFNEPIPSRTYFHTAHSKISLSRAGDAILPKISVPDWREVFSTYRNALTHELILAAKYHIDFDIVGGTRKHSIVFPLPDDPRAAPSSRHYRKNPDAQKYVQEHFRKILSLMNIVYGHIIERATANGSLPI